MAKKQLWDYTDKDVTQKEPAKKPLLYDETSNVTMPNGQIVGGNDNYQLPDYSGLNPFKKGQTPASFNTSNSQFNPSSKVNGYDATANDWLNKLYGQANKMQGGVVSQDVWDALNSKYTQSPAVTDAFNKTQALLNKINEGKTTYSDKIAGLMDQISGRGKFEYDPNTDTLFQNALASAMASGQTAMQDTIGQASALTGGYGSTYATTAGNQAYNSFVQDAYNNLPEYYQMAMENYEREGNDLYNQLGMYNDADANEWNRLMAGYDANNSNWQTLYGMDRQQWQDAISNAVNKGQLQMSEANNIYDALNSAYNASQSQADREYNREMAKYQMAMDAKNNADNLALNYAKAGFTKNADGTWSPAQTAGGTASAGDNLTDKQYNAILEMYQSKGGGEQGYQSVINYLNAQGIDLSDTAVAALENEFNNIPTSINNNDWQLSNNSHIANSRDEYSYTDANGETHTMTYAQLKKLAKDEGMDKDEMNKWLNDLRNQQKNKWAWFGNL